MKINFSDKAQRVIDLVQGSRQNIFVTGKAGTGKSTLLQYIRQNAKQKVIVVAPTGISAINVNGDTIHSFFGLKPGFEKDEAKKMRIDEKKQKKFKQLKTIAIDEISMVRADLLDAIDIVLRRARQEHMPFGGVQMIFFGDLYQLPPVVTSADRDKFFSEYPTPYFFSAEVLTAGQQDSFFGNGFSFEHIELDEIYRQSDATFIELLNAVRNNTATTQDFAQLNTRHDPGFVPDDEEQYIHLVTTNAAAKAINTRKLEELDAENVTFEAGIKDNVPKSLYPNDTEITICEGAQVMFINNDAERRWVNGTIGTVTNIGKEGSAYVVTVEKADGKTVSVDMHTWEISKYVMEGGSFQREMMGSFTQIPLKLAWAITIHKSQGKTFDNVIIDLGRGSFAHGQTYVALSRCTSLEGIVLKQPLSARSIIMDKRVQNFGK